MSRIPRPGTKADQVIVAQARDVVEPRALDAALPVVRDVFPEAEQISVQTDENSNRLIINTGSDTLFASDLATIEEINRDKIDLKELADSNTREEIEETVSEAFEGALFDEGGISVFGNKEGMFGLPRPIQSKNQEFHLIVQEELPHTDEVMSNLADDAAKGIGGQLSWEYYFDVDGPTIVNKTYKDNKVIVEIEESMFILEDLVSTVYGSDREPILHIDGVEEAEIFTKAVYEDGYAVLK